MNSSEVYDRLQSAIFEALQYRLRNVPAELFSDLRNWPGTVNLSRAAASAALEVVRSVACDEQVSPSQHLESLVPNGFLVEDRVSTTREDRAYQVLCALLSCSRAPMGSTAGELANIAWALVGCMEERGAQKDEE